ncbi:MAG: mechanosensitive ion channel [Paludibacteraceae bacterium]|nr:mechanosensitive ion channel [Paludibacteraceae bacterium]
MILLQELGISEEVAAEKVQKLSPDSIHQTVHSVIQEVQTNPEGFWQSALQDLTQFGLKVVAALAIYFVGMWVIRYIKRIITRIFERRNTERTLATFISSLVSITLTVMLILATVGTLGVDTTSFAALLTAGGMAIGMALSGTVQNFAGGIMLLIFRPFKSGDYIRAQGEEGFVTDVSIVSTKILTYNNKVIILPNGNLFTGNIENLSAQGVLRVEWEVSVEYGVDAGKCREAMIAILRSDQRVLNNETYPPKEKGHKKKPMIDVASVREINYNPAVILRSLNSSDITFVVRGWVHTPDYWDVKADLQERFYTELPPQGFGFAYPHMDVHITHPVEIKK